MRPLGFSANFAWALAGSLGLSLSQWLLLIALTKTRDTVAVGEWVLALSVTGPPFVLALLKLRQIQATDARGENTFGDFLVTRLLATLLALAGTVAFVAFSYRTATGITIAGMALAKAFEGISDLVYGSFQRARRLDRVGMSQCGRALTVAALGAGGLLMGAEIHALALGLAGTYAAWSAIDLWALQRAGMLAWREARPSRARVLKLLRISAPLGVSTAVGSLQLNLPRYFLEAYAGRAQVGIFGSLSQLLLVGSLVIGAGATAAVSPLSSVAVDGRWGAFARLLSRLLLAAAGLGLAAVAVAALAGRELLTVIYTPVYAQHSEVLVVLAFALGLVWTYIFLSTALDAMRRFSVSPWVHAAGTLAILVMCTALVPRLGMLGASYAMLTGYAVEALLFALVVGPRVLRLARSEAA